MSSRRLSTPQRVAGGNPRMGDEPLCQLHSFLSGRTVPDDAGTHRSCFGSCLQRSRVTRRSFPFSMTSKSTPPASTFDGIKKRYRSLLERLYAEKGVSDEMKCEARELYVEAQLLNGDFASEMRMTSVERREAQGKVTMASR